MTHVRRRALDGWMAESTPDQTPGPSRAHWMEGGGGGGGGGGAIDCARHMYAHSAYT